MTSSIINKTYLSVREEIKELEISKKEIISAFTISFFTNLLIVSGFIAIFASLLLFTDLEAICIFIITNLVGLFLFLTDFMTLKLLVRGRVLGLYHIYIVDLMYIFILVNIISIIIMIGVF